MSIQDMSIRKETQKLEWCALGDSFTYLNDHQDETGFRVKKGYMTRVCERFENLRVRNMGINGSCTGDWIDVPLPEADIYTVLLGTNDWHQGIPLGNGECFDEKREGTILGNLGILLSHIRNTSPRAAVLVMNPVERGDFVYILDPTNHAHGSYAPDGGQMLSDIARGICTVCAERGIPMLDLHSRSGFAPETAVKFKRVHTEEGSRDLPYPDYVGLPVDYERDEYPYPPEAANLTYDGLHPTDEGNEVIAALLAEEMKSLLGERLREK